MTCPECGSTLTRQRSDATHILYACLGRRLARKPRLTADTLREWRHAGEALRDARWYARWAPWWRR